MTFKNVPPQGGMFFLYEQVLFLQKKYESRNGTRVNTLSKVEDYFLDFREQKATRINGSYLREQAL